MIYGALLWMADKLKGGQGEQARALWIARGTQAFEADSATRDQTDQIGPALRR
ncbi:MAG: conjugal transfer protein TraD, partial [Bradyrhizobium sp.]|nr:conjugal transfer protein TraD [Bradyrhizobium sp.]